MITIDVSSPEGTVVYFQGGAFLYPVEADALRFVAEQQARRPGLTAKVIA